MELVHECFTSIISDAEPSNGSGRRQALIIFFLASHSFPLGLFLIS